MSALSGSTLTVLRPSRLPAVFLFWLLLPGCPPEAAAPPRPPESSAPPPVESSAAPVESSAAPVESSAAPPRAADPSRSAGGGQEALVAAINRQRAESGLSPLALDRSLTRAAQERAEAIARHGELPASTEDIGDLGRLIRREGYEAWVWREAVTAGESDLGAILAGWERERPEAYRASVLGDFEHLGVGIAREGAFPVVDLLFARTRLSHQRRATLPLRDVERVRRAILARTNEARREAGLSAVARSASLDRIAGAYAAMMLRRGFYGHSTPEGETLRERLGAGGYPGPRIAGENLAKGLFDPGEVVERWLASRDHRRNILLPEVTESGLGLAVGEREGEIEVLWVQILADPATS